MIFKKHIRKLLSITIILVSIVLSFIGCAQQKPSNTSYNSYTTTTNYSTSKSTTYKDGICERCGKYVGSSQIGNEKVCGNCFEKYLVERGAATPVDQYGNEVNKEDYLAGKYD